MIQELSIRTSCETRQSSWEMAKISRTTVCELKKLGVRFNNRSDEKKFTILWQANRPTTLFTISIKECEHLHVMSVFAWMCASVEELSWRRVMSRAKMRPDSLDFWSAAYRDRHENPPFKSLDVIRESSQLPRPFAWSRTRLKKWMNFFPRAHNPAIAASVALIRFSHNYFNPLRDWLIYPFPQKSKLFA
jgi:hypothetical protein